jgi:hypothetical protein
MALGLAGMLAMGGLSSAGSAYGQHLENQGNRELQDKSHAFSSHEAQKNREWQQMMSSTSYQRSMQDMRTAGLNPMLAFKQGGASTPSGSSGSSTPARVGSVLGSAVSSARDTLRYKKEVAAVDSQIKLNDMAAKTQASQAKLNETNATVSAKNARALDATIGAVSQRAKAEKATAVWDEKAATYDAFQRRIHNLLGTTGSALDVVNPFRKHTPQYKNRRR